MFSKLKKTYFGVFALFFAVLAVSSIVANYSVAYMNISTEVFARLNVLTASFYCVLTPLAFVLGVLGIYFKNDHKALSWSALIVVTIPFLINLAQMVFSLMDSN